MVDLMEGQVIDVLPDAPLAAEVCVGEQDVSAVLLIIHSAPDQIRIHGLRPEHARLIHLAINAPFYEETTA